MEWIILFVVFALVAVLLGDGFNIYLSVSMWLLVDWITGDATSLILIPSSIFAIAGAIAGNGKRQVEFEKKKMLSNESGK